MMARALWRIAKETRDYPADDLSGRGAAATGGRWNSRGRAAVYASESIALALLETIAHLGDERHPRNRYLVELRVPEPVYRRRIAAVDLPRAWDAEPAGIASMAYGDAWIDGARSALLVVPSVIVPEGFNFLLNPDHPDARKITAAVLRKVIYDPRILLRR